MYNFRDVLERMLSHIPEDMDTRQSSPVFNGLAPVAMEIADLFIEMLIWSEQSNLESAVGENLDKVGGNFVISRKQASQAIRIGATYNQSGSLFEIPLGSRFAVPETNNEITYILTEYTIPGIGYFLCEQAGTAGNDYYGDLLPLQVVNNLSRVEITEIHITGSDTEDDDVYRARIIERLRDKPFGGNIADYKRALGEIAGIGQRKIFPVWAGGGTVLASILDPENNPAAPSLIAAVKAKIDPEEYTGLGVGLAPIGHSVTITTPELCNIVAEMSLTLNGVTNAQVRDAVIAAVQNYFAGIITTWETADSLKILIAGVIASVMQVPGVVNVQNVKLNGQTNDIILTDTAQTQLIPSLGNVILI